jgi:hypothetical protein
MDTETKLYLAFAIVLAVFGLMWKYNPLNPEFVFYPGMVMGVEQMMVYLASLIGVSIAIFIYAWAILVE